MTPKKDPADYLPLGAPKKYRPAFNKQAYKMALLGLTDKQMADIFDVSEPTFNAWKKDYPLFFKSLTEGKALADANVGAKLYERALGYSHKSEEIKVVEGEIVRVETIKHYPPSETAAIFWLKNRQPKIWRDKQEVENTNRNIEVQISDDEAKALADKILKDI